MLEDRDVEGLVRIHAEDCEVGNVSVSETFRGHEGLREFWTEYRKTFGEMKSSFRNVIATETASASNTVSTPNRRATDPSGVAMNSRS